MRFATADSAKLAFATIGATDSSIAYPDGAFTPAMMFTATMSPSAGAEMVEAATAACALATAAWAVATWAWSASTVALAAGATLRSY